MNERLPTLVVRWTGEHFLPGNPAVLKRCRDNFEAGELYRIELEEDHSTDKSRRHYFAALRQAWNNLPPHLAEHYPSPEHLRKKTLVICGYHKEYNFIFDSAAHAKDAGRHMREMDSYAVIIARGNVLRVYQAKSQSRRSMKKAEFQASKTAVLNEVADMIGVAPATLSANAPDDRDDHERNPTPSASEYPEDRDPPPDPEPPMRRTPTNPPAEALRGPADTPPLASPGGSTPSGVAPHNEDETSDRPEQTETASGGNLPQPRTYNEYLIYLNAWLGYVKSADRITKRIAEEKETMWPKLNPALTLGQRNYFMRLATEAIARL